MKKLLTIAGLLVFMAVLATPGPGADFTGRAVSVPIRYSGMESNVPDAGVLSFGDDQDVSFTYNTTSGLLVITGGVEVEDGATFTGAITVGDATGAVTFNSGTYNTSNSDDNFTNVADIALDTISADDGSSFAISDDFTNAGNTIADLGIVTTVDVNGGSIDGAIIGAASAVAITGSTITGTTLTDGIASVTGGTFSGIADLGAVTTADINAGTVDAVLGGTTPAAASVTDVTISGAATGLAYPINMNSITAMTGDNTTACGNMIKMNRSAGAIGGTHSGALIKNYITGGAVDGTGLVSGLYINLKYQPDSENVAAEVSLIQSHLYSDASDAIDYGWYCLAPTSKISSLLGVSGTMTNFLEVKSSGAAGVTVSADGMAAEPHTGDEAGFITIKVEGTGESYQIPFYND